MRTFDEIQADIQRASSINDVEALRALATEMQALGTPQAEAAVRNALGNASFLIGDYPQALEHYRRALAVYEELGDRVGVARDTGNMGNVYADTGDYRRALAMFEELDDRASMAVIAGNIGNVHLSTGDYPTALEHYHCALAMHEVLGDHSGVARAISNIGGVHEIVGDFQAALEHFQRALAMYEEMGDRNGEARVTSNMGVAYGNVSDHSAALKHFYHALAIHEDLGEPGSVSWVLGNIASALLAIGQDAKAAAILDRQSSLSMDDPMVLSRHHCNRATIDERGGDFDSARAQLLQALSIVNEVGVRGRVAEVQKELRDLAQKRNDFAGFIEHNAEFLRITEEIRGKEATQKLTMMAAERKMDAERREHEKQRSVLYATLPRHVADRVIRGEDVSSDHFDHAAVMFLDIVGFTSHTSTMPPAEVVKLLEHIFSTIDGICETHNVVKVKTIGDSYMCFRGDADAATNALSIARVGIAVMHGAFTWRDGEMIQFRGGMHIGTATAGVIGTQRLQYDVWGDTVNVASRLEGTSEPGRIHVSEAFADVLRSSSDPAPYNLIQRGEVEIKGKGAMTTYWLEGAA
jgi:adenylate cyclase